MARAMYIQVFCTYAPSFNALSQTTGCTVGLPDFGKSSKIIVEPGFSHEFDHAEFNGAQKNQIQKYLGVAILN